MTGTSTSSPMTATTRSVTTTRGITATVRVFDHAPNEPAAHDPVVFFHGFSGLFDDEPLLSELATGRTVFAPVLPGYGPEDPASGEHQIDDMLELTLHGWDLVDALGISPETTVHLIGHSMGAMIAAEMAAVAPTRVSRLGLISPLGLWNPQHPIADIFSLLPFEFPGLLFHDAEQGTALLAGGRSFDDPKAIESFQVRNSRRLGFAGKLLFPIPNRRFSKRAYRIGMPTDLVWGAHDRLTPTNAYAAAWTEAIKTSTTTVIANAGHYVTLERPPACAAALLA
jgi:pimeloyl-ACP methyl ester carboxylesterase